MSAIELMQRSRAGKEAEQEPESEPQRKWVALVSVAVLLGNEDDDRAQAMAIGTDVLLDLKDPPLPSSLVLHPRVTPKPRSNEEPLSAYILAADRSAYILLQVVQGNRPDFFLCDTHSRTVTILPPVSSFLQTSQGLDISPQLSIGLIADPLRRGHYVVAQLQPATWNRNRLLCYSTAKRGWFVSNLTRQMTHMMLTPLIDNDTVLAHNGRLWWIALGYGIFFCDPLGVPELRFLPLPAGCQMIMNAYASLESRIRTLIHQRRCVRPSEGKLRFVEIRGLAYGDVLVDARPGPANPTVWMWTLEDPERPDPWTLEYEVPFAEIWDNETYADAGLLPGEVPHVALVDPNDHCVVYFFQGSKLFGLDVRKKQVIACKECLIDRDQVIMFQSSRPIVDAWELSPSPPTLPGDEDNVSPRQPDEREKKCRVTESVHSWLSDVWEWTRGDVDDEMSGSASSHTSGGQADDAPEIQLPSSP